MTVKWMAAPIFPMSQEVQTGKQTTNSNITLSYFLWQHLRWALCWKQPGLLAVGPILLHDYALSHKTEITQDPLQCWQFWSSDMTPCDYTIFPNMKGSLWGQRFPSQEEVEHTVQQPIRQLITTHAVNELHNLPQTEARGTTLKVYHPTHALI